MISPTDQNRLYCCLRLSLFTLLLLSTTGCSLREHLTSWKNSDPSSEFLITYTVKNAVRDLNPWSSFADHGPQPASWTAEEQPENEASRSAALQIEYPHPERGQDFALATLSVYDQPLNEEQFTAQPKKRWYHRLLINNYLSSRKQRHAPSPTEIVTMLMPRTQFEMLVDEMNQTRYLDENHSSKQSFATALLSISKNRKSIHESSVEEPRLNEVIQNVYRDGEVILGEKRHSSPSILQTSAFVEAPHPTMVN